MMNDSSGISGSRCAKCGGVHPLTDSCPLGLGEGARAGQTLDGKYLLIRLLGQGGMGEVYEARHTKIGRRIAVKFLHGQYATHPEIARRFENEARAAGEVQHENIAGVYDVGSLPDGTQYLVMEFLDGEDIDRVIRRERALPLARAADLIVQACQGLDVVHKRGIVHRDLKPANLFVVKRANGSDLVKVLDFGIAKLRPEGNAAATATGVALGTPYYMSPEQARGERDIGTRSDIYALGVIFYELLAGRRPHEGDSLLAILHNILTQPPIPLEMVVPGLPEPVYGAVRRAMATNVAERFQSVGEFAEAILPYAGGGSLRASQPVGMDATRIETAGVRVGPRTPVSGGAPARSVSGMASTGGALEAAPAKSSWRGIAIVVSVIAVVAMGVEGGLLLKRAKEAKDAAAAAALSASAAVSVVSAAPSASAHEVATAAAANASAGAPADKADGADKADKAKGVSADMSGQSGPTGQSAGSGHPGDAVAAPEPRKVHGQGAQAGVQAAGAGLAKPPGATPGQNAKATHGHAGDGPAKPDCSQTYTIDSDGNKHFRPECFGK
jgi:tRNA A-37 threonylcarbamoyl transferase component Bud32